MVGNLYVIYIDSFYNINFYSFQYFFSICVIYCFINQLLILHLNFCYYHSMQFFFLFIGREPIM